MSVEIRLHDRVSFEHDVHSASSRDVFDVPDSAFEELANALAKLGYADDAAKETTELLLLLRQTRVRAEAIQGRLEDVWRTLWQWSEYKMSEDMVKVALKRYRGE